jgi:hypothetical protein
MISESNAAAAISLACLKNMLMLPWLSNDDVALAGVALE